MVCSRIYFKYSSFILKTVLLLKNESREKKTKIGRYYSKFVSAVICEKSVKNTELMYTENNDICVVRCFLLAHTVDYLTNVRKLIKTD